MEDDINTAMRKGYFQQVRLLVRLGVDVNNRDEFSRTPLMNCALVDDERWGVGLARTLLEHGARSAPRDRLGLTAVHYACVHRRPALVAVLLAAADFDVRATDRRGNSALHYAAATGDGSATAALLAVYRRYRLPVDAVNRAGQTALVFAYHNEQMDCAQMIRDCGEAVRAGTVDQKSATDSQLSTQVNGSEVEDSARQLDKSDTALRCLSPSMPRMMSLPVNGGGRDGEMLIGDDDVDGLQRPWTAVDVNCPRMAVTATSARQRRANRRPRNVVRDQMSASISARPSLAVRTSRRMLHSSDTSTKSLAGDTTSVDGSPSGTTNVDWNIDELIPKSALNVRLLRPAPVRDPHSRPLLKILHQSAAEFFDSVSNGPSMSDRHVGDEYSWRVNIYRLYDNYSYQFSPLYKPPASAASSVENGVAGDSSSSTGGGGMRTRNSSSSELPLRSGRKSSAFRSGEGLSAVSGSARKKSVMQSPGSVHGAGIGGVGPVMRRSVSRSSLSTMAAETSRSSIHRRTSRSRSVTDHVE